MRSIIFAKLQFFVLPILSRSKLHLMVANKTKPLLFLRYIKKNTFLKLFSKHVTPLFKKKFAHVPTTHYL